MTYVETIKDLVGDNAGPLVKFHNLDKGLFGDLAQAGYIGY